MEYKGKLYGRVGGSLIPLECTTDDWERMEKEISELKAKLEKPLPTDEQIEQSITEAVEKEKECIRQFLIDDGYELLADKI